MNTKLFVHLALLFGSSLAGLTKEEQAIDDDCLAENEVINGVSTLESQFRRKSGALTAQAEMRRAIQ